MVCAPCCKSGAAAPHSKTLARIETLTREALGRSDGVGHEHRDGHRTDAAGHRRDPTRALPRTIEVNVTAQLALAIPSPCDPSLTGATAGDTSIALSGKLTDTAKGLRPGFSTAAPPELGRRLFNHLVTLARQSNTKVETGIFGAHMQVSLTNDGPVTIWLES